MHIQYYTNDILLRYQQQAINLHIKLIRLQNMKDFLEKNKTIRMQSSSFNRDNVYLKRHYFAAIRAEF